MDFDKIKKNILNSSETSTSESESISSSELHEEFEINNFLPEFEPLKLSGKNLAQQYVSAFNTGMNIYQCVNQLQGYIEWVVKAVNDVVKSWDVQVGESIDQSKAIVRGTTTEQFNVEWTNKQPELIEQVNTLTTNQFNNEKSIFNDELNALNARMDTFTSLSSGSTTGDAELQDIRVGANGVTYPNAGDAVRGQYSQLKEELVDEITNRNTAINDAVTTERNRAISIENTKISKPSTEDNNKFARAKNGNVEWVEQGLPTYEQTENAVRNWLNEHPEATTTVQNNTLDIEKMTSEMQKLARNFSDSVRKPLVSFTSDDGSINGDINIMGAILRRHNVPATCAVITGDGLSEEKKNAYLDMQNNYGWEIASHSIDSTLLGTISESDCERYLEKSKKILVDAGFNVNGVVYPSGSANQNVRRLAKKYYQYGCNYNDKVNVDLFLDSFSISRIPLGAFYTDATHNTLEYYKSCVDKAVESNGWCVFCLHPYKEDFDETQQRYLEELIEYIESLNVEMVTLSKGYEVFGNIIESGKSFNESTEDEFERFVVTNDGRTNLPIFYAKGSSVLSSMIPTDFRDRCITICNVSRYVDETYPDSASGIIVTMRCGDIFLQLWFPSNSNRVYRRTSTSKTSSGTFSLITPILAKTRINIYSAAQSADAYPSEQITVTEVTTGKSLGFPTKEGTLITKKLPNYTSQLFIPASADDEIYMRRWDTTAKAWTQFINVLRNKIGNTYTYFGTISTIWKSIPTNIVNGLYIKSLKSISGRTLGVPKPYFTVAELSTDKENPTVIASSDGYSVKLQAYIDDKGQLYFKYSEVGNNYVGLLEVAYN